jgi:hypothetical protein
MRFGRENRGGWLCALVERVVWGWSGELGGGEEGAFGVFGGDGGLETG